MNRYAEFVRQPPAWYLPAVLGTLFLAAVGLAKLEESNQRS